MLLCFHNRHFVSTIANYLLRCATFQTTMQHIFCKLSSVTCPLRWQLPTRWWGQCINSFTNACILNIKKCHQNPIKRLKYSSKGHLEEHMSFFLKYILIITSGTFVSMAFVILQRITKTSTKIIHLFKYMKTVNILYIMYTRSILYLQ